MSVETKSWRPAPLIPAADGFGVGLAVSALLIGLVASLALGWLGADLRAKRDVAPRLGGEATFAVAAARGPEPLESATAAAWRAAESLSSLPGVASAKVLDPAPGDGALAQTLGVGDAARDPGRLIAVKAAGGPAGLSSAGWLRHLRGEGLTAAVDDHRLTSGPIERGLLMSALRLTGLCLVSLIAMAAIGAWGVDRLILRHAMRIRLMSAFGMTDLDLLRGVLTPVLVATIIASGLGAVVGGLLAEGGGLRPPGLAPFVTAPRGLDLLIILLWPPLGVLAGLGVAAVMARRQLRRLNP
jgi:hypothetical protein